MVVRGLFGRQKAEGPGGWRRLHTEKLHKLYSSPDMVRMVMYEMDRECSTNGGKKNAYRLLVGKAEGKRPLGRSRRRWAVHIKMD
jgi:hypothetical protein